MRLTFNTMFTCASIMILAGCSNVAKTSSENRFVAIDVENKTAKAIPMAEIRNSISIFAKGAELSSTYFDYSIQNDCEHPFEEANDRILPPNAIKRIEIDPKHLSSHTPSNHIESSGELPECETMALIDGDFSIMIDAPEYMGIATHSKSDAKPVKVILIKRKRTRAIIDEFQKKDHIDWVRRHPDAGA